MSYSAMISFKKLPIEDVNDFFVSLKKASIENLSKIGADEWPYCPLCKAHVFKEDDKFEEVIYGNDRKEFHLYEKSLDWASRVFSWRYGYDKEYGLLFVFGVPNAIAPLFDCTVCFQNSSDNDYEIEYWSGVDAFEAVYKKWMDTSDEEIRAAISDDYDDYEDDPLEECDGEALDYFRRTMAYKEIWSHFEDTLYDDDASIYISMFGSIYDEHHRQTLIKAAFNAAKKDHMEFMKKAKGGQS